MNHDDMQTIAYAVGAFFVAVNGYFTWRTSIASRVAAVHSIANGKTLQIVQQQVNGNNEKLQVANSDLTDRLITAMRGPDAQRRATDKDGTK